MDAVELEIHKANTRAFIDVKPSVLALTPKTDRVRTAAGGWKDADAAPRQPQTFRIIELGTRAGRQEIKLQDGSLREVVFWLLGEVDAQIDVDDWWTAEDGRLWQVADIVRSNGYETRAPVVERGR